MIPHETGVTSFNFEPTNRCNEKCVFCPREKFMRKIKLHDMSMANFYHIFYEAKEFFPAAKFITFGLYGEPTLHKDLYKMIGHANINGFTTRISTNGMLLTPRLSKHLVNAGLNIVNISVDDCDPVRLEKIRVGSKFNVLLENIKYLYSLIEETHLPTQITIYPVICKENRKDKDRIVRFWSNFSHRCRASEEIDVGLNERNIKNYSVPLKYRLIPMKVKMKLGMSPHCYNWFVVRSNGDVVPCCHDIFHDIVFGNTLKEPISEIWNNDKIKEFRQSLGNGILPELCRKCRFQVYFK